jgi:hypothetical protein
MSHKQLIQGHRQLQKERKMMKLRHVLQKAECGEPLSSHELQFLLGLSKLDELNQFLNWHAD